MLTQIEWRGLVVEIQHTANWLNTGFDHIEIKAESKLPITETGYRSHFIDPGDLAEYADPAAFVRYWLNVSATDWDAQLSLF